MKEADSKHPPTSPDKYNGVPLKFNIRKPQKIHQLSESQTDKIRRQCTDPKTGTVNLKKATLKWIQSNPLCD